jgi:outer membrane protein OmpA-like peptidoglycan-associated protein
MRVRPGILVTAALSCAASANADPCSADPEITTTLATKLSFEAGRSRLSDAAKAAVQPIVRMLQAHPDLHIVITGHTTEPHGGDTAKRRAEVVKGYLVDAGIMPDRLDTRVSEQVAASVIEFAVACAPAAPAPAPDSALDALDAKLTFELGHARLTDEAKAALQPLVAAMRGSPALHLVVVAHYTGERDAHIADTAKRRADVIKWYLVDASIIADRIETRVSTVVTRGYAIELRVSGDAAAAASLQTVHSDAEDLAKVFSSGGDPRGRRLGANLEQQIADVRVRQHLAVGGSSRPHTPATAPPATSLRSLEITAPSRRTSGEPPTRSRYTAAAPTLVPAPSAFASKITTVYMTGLAHCYRKSLAQDPSISGRIQISFAIDASGALVAPEASGVDPDLDTCVRAQMTRWRFAPTADPEARFSVSLVLQRN